MITTQQRRQIEIVVGKKFIVSYRRIKNNAPLGWEPEPYLKSVLSLTFKVVASCIEQERLFAKDLEDLWRKPRLRADGAPRAVTLEDTTESRASAGFTHRNFLTPKYRRKRGGRRVNKKYYRRD